MQSKYRNG